MYTKFYLAPWQEVEFKHSCICLNVKWQKHTEAPDPVQYLEGMQGTAGRAWHTSKSINYMELSSPSVGIGEQVKSYTRACRTF